MMLTILAAAALALPDAAGDFARQVERDVPREVLETDVAGIWYQGFVDPEGKITSCAIRGAMGETNSAALACQAVKGRHITPATIDGKAAYGVYRGAIVLTANPFDPDDIVFAPDVQLEVEHLPSDKPLRTELIVMVDEQGRISQCRSSDGRNPAYARVACDQAKEILMPVGKSESGEAVAYVYPLTYEFTENLAAN
jgi:hypothetical protein